MKLPVVNAEGKEVRKLDVDDSVFGIEPNVSVLHQAYVIQRNNQRWGTANTKTRGQVAGSTRKIHRQKGTGRARAGTQASPTRVGGGIAFGPHQRDYTQSMPKKMRRLAIRSALSGKAADGQLVVIDQLAFEGPRTKEMVRVLGNVGIQRSVLIVTAESDRQILASARNLVKTKVLPARYLNVGDMMNHQGLLMTEEAIKIAEELWKIELKKAKKEEKAEPRRSRGKAKDEAEPVEVAAEAPATEEEEAKPGRRTRFVKKDAEAEAEATTEASSEAEAPTEDKPKPARRTRKPAAAKDAPATEASAEEKPKRATRSRAKTDKDTEEKPKTTRRRTTKKTEEGEG